MGDGSPNWYRIGQAGNLMPPFRASPIRSHSQRCLSASVAVFRFTPAASYMRGIGLPGPMAFLGGWSAAAAQTAMECDQVVFVSTNEST
jgi:hypothetical protein